MVSTPRKKSADRRKSIVHRLWPWLLVMGLAAAYTALFPTMYHHFGPASRLFSLSFVLVAAWWWGLWGGIVAALGNLGLSLLLHWSMGLSYEGGPLGVLVTLGLAVLVGRLADVQRRLHRRIEEERATERELASYRDRLEEMVQARTAELSAANQRLEQEIAERGRAEEALKNSEEKYRLVVENASEAILVAQDGKIKLFNARAVAMTGYSLDELTDSSFVQFIHPEDRAMVIERHQRRMAGEKLPSAYDFRIITADGETRWLEVNAVRFEWDGRPATLNFLTDVTERRATEAALKESESRFRELAELMPQTVFEVDVQGRLTFVNQGAFTQFGYTPEDLAQGLNAFGMVVPEDRDRAVANARQVMSGHDIGMNEYLFQRRDGTTFPALLHSNPIEREGRILGLRGFIIDITDRKRVEEALRESEKKFSKAFMIGPDSIAITRLSDGVFLEVNENLLNTLGYRRDEVIGRSAAELNNWAVPEDRQRFVQAIQERGECRDLETAFRTKDGVLLPHLISGVRLEAEDEEAILSISRDITERKQAEEALRQNEARYRLLVDYAPAGIYEIDFSTGRFLSVNDVMVELGGYTREEFLEMNAFDFLTEDSQRLFLERQQMVAAGEEIPQPVEFQIRKKDGEELWVLVASKLQFGEGGKVRATAVIHDITALKAAEEALKASEEMFQRAFRSSPDWVSISTLDEGRYLDVNEGYCQGTGWSREEVIGRTSSEIGLWVDPEDRRRGAELIEKEGRLKQLEAIFRRKNGEEIIALWSAEPVRLGDQECIISVVQDITDKKKAEESLRASEQRFRDLFNSITDIIYTQDLQGRFLSVNKALAQLFGYSVEELIGRRAAEFMKPELQEAYDSEYLEALRTKGFHEGVSLYFRRDGARRFIEYKSTLVTPEDGEPYISGIGRDVTERIRSERQLQSLQTQLLQAQKMEAVGTLASGIAHDFNNILHAVSGYLELLDARDQAVPPDHAYLKEINLLVERAAELVRRLLTFSRKVESRPELVDLNGEVIQTVKMLERTIPKMIEIKTDLAEDLWPVRGDRTQIEQVVMNLGANAKDAMPQGGRLFIQTSNVTLDEEYCRSQVDVSPGEYVRLRVSDTGHGMDEETAQHIFEPFFTTKGVGQGTGLGLSTVYGIIKGHRGHITCYSAEGQGTTFDIFLPALAGAQAELEEPTSIDPALPRGDETILLVDDEPSVLDIAQDILDQYGYNVLRAMSGEEALEVYRRRGPKIDLVILDLNMPGMGGHVCLDELVKMDSAVKVLVASGYPAGGLEESVVQAGARGFVGKPYRLAHFLTRVREALNQNG